MQVWVEKRAKQVAAAGAMSGYGLVLALNVGVVAGLPLAAVAMLWANRWLPAEVAERSAWEIRAFCAVWIAAAVWAVARLRRGKPWRDLFAATSALMIGLPFVSMATAQQAALPHTLMKGDWRMAMVDLTLLILGAAFAWLARRAARVEARAEAAEPIASGEPA